MGGKEATIKITDGPKYRFVSTGLYKEVDRGITTYGAAGQPMNRHFQQFTKCYSYNTISTSPNSLLDSLLPVSQLVCKTHNCNHIGLHNISV